MKLQRLPLHMQIGSSRHETSFPQWTNRAR